MKKNTYKAFSLIELSIVILVIGILVAGVMQGKSLIQKSRLKTAQSLTKSSPVSGIYGLLLWLEPTMEESFLTTESEDGTQLTQWKDINTQNQQKYFAVKTASTSGVYKDSSPIGSLPSVYFDGSTTNHYFTLSTTTSTSNATPINTQKTQYTFFLVAWLEDFSNNPLQRTAFHNGSVNPYHGFGYMVKSQNTYASTRSITNTLGAGVASAATSRTLEIISITNAFNSTNSSTCPLSSDYANDTTARIYINGSQTGTSSVTLFACNPLSKLTIGGADIDSTTSDTNSWKGYISELIVFDKPLSDKDRKSVEQYLGQKYNIVVSQ